MACRFEISVAAGTPAAVGACALALDDVDRIESQLSVFRDDSEVSRLNRAAAGGEIAVSPDLHALLARCSRLHRETDGAFDPTSGPLTRCWGFFRRAGAVPPSERLLEAREGVGFSHVRIDSDARRVSFTRPGVELNFGGIGKGYALDAAARTLRRNGVAAALLSGGSSSVLAFGEPSRRRWPVGLRDPRARDRRWAILHLRDAALATSGAGEQFFETDGRRYGHILDPRTGVPADGQLATTVVTSSAADADALATAFFVGGQALARAYCDTHDDVLVLMHEEGRGDPIIVGSHGGCRVQIC
jgi:thiamine biosynthesis lipoprotein